MSVDRSQLGQGGVGSRGAGSRGWTFVESLAVIALAGAALVVGALSVHRGRVASEQLACQDQMRAIRSALEIYWAREGRSYPADQAQFERFLQDRAYFLQEPRCPGDEQQSRHYRYTRRASDPGPEGITITCPAPGSGHGSV